MRSAALTCLLLASCAGRCDGGAGPPPSPPSPDGRDAMAEHDRSSSSSDARARPCATRTCLGENEGQVIEIEGTYFFPKQPAFAVSRLALADGTTVVLSPPPEGERRRHFTAASDGKRMRIRGRIFTGVIPDRYKIIGRTSEPYLVELEAITPAP